MNTNDSPKTKFIVYTLVSLIAGYPLHPAIGQGIVSADNNTNIHTDNNVPVIDIAKPNDSGVSHNIYQEFNIDKNGVILNNSSENTKTELNGNISANAKLENKPANLIINEIVTGNSSSLNGTLEVAGKNAGIVISNPNGISCNGCDFINSDSVTITTGVPNLNSKGELESITVNRGNIAIGEDGLNYRRHDTDYVNLISKTAELRGKVTSNQKINVVLGKNNINLKTGEVKADNNIIAKPEVSIDTKALGGMISGQIKLVSTEDGVGVNLKNITVLDDLNNEDDLTIISAGDINLENIESYKSTLLSADKVKLNHVNSQNNLNIKSDRLFIPKDAIVGSQHIKLSIDSDFVNDGTLFSGKSISYSIKEMNYITEASLMKSPTSPKVIKDKNEKDIQDSEIISSNKEIFASINNNKSNRVEDPDKKNIKDSYYHNKIEVININTPNSSGVSYNGYDIFNVPAEGLVLNNSLISYKSVLAGDIGGNKKFSDRTAKIIINEVLGGGKSKLYGNIEIAGSPASLIISNPNGIDCDGCGFINSNYVTLATAKLLENYDGTLEVSSGEINFSGNVNLENINYFDVLSKRININSSLTADKLSIIQGGFYTELNGNVVRKIKYNTKNPQEEYPDPNFTVIDFGNNSKITANSLSISVLTDYSTANLSGFISVVNNFTINANNALINVNKVFSNGTVNIVSKQLILPSFNSDISGDNIFISSKYMTNNGGIKSKDSLRIFAQNFYNYGNLFANNNIWVQGNKDGGIVGYFKNENSSIISVYNDIIIRASSFHNASLNMRSGNNLFMYADDLLIQGGDVFAKGNIIAVGSNFSLETKQYLDDLTYKYYNESIDKIKNSDEYKSITNPFYYPYKYTTIERKVDNGWYQYTFPSRDIILNSGTLIRLLQGGPENYYTEVDQSLEDHEYKNFIRNENIKDITIVYNKLQPVFNKIREINNYIAGSKIEHSIGTISSDSDIVIDYYNSVNIEAINGHNGHNGHNINFKLPVSEKNILHSKNIIIKSDNINISGAVFADNNLSLISDRMISNNSIFSSNKSLSITSLNDSALNSTNLNSPEISVISKSGNIYFSSERDNFLDCLYLSSISSSYNSLFNAGKNIVFNNIIYSNINNINFFSNGDILVSRNINKLNKYININDYVPDEDTLNKTNTLFAKSNFTATALKNINIEAVKIKTGKDLNLNSGGDISFTLGSVWGFLNLKELNYHRVELQSDSNVNINAAGKFISKSAYLNSGKNITILSGGDNIFDATKYSKNTMLTNEDVDDRHLVSEIDSSGDLTISSNGLFKTKGSRIHSGGNLIISGLGNIAFESVINQKSEKNSDLFTHQSTDISSNKNLSIISGGSILFQATKLLAGNVMNIMAKGGFLYAKSMEETYTWEEEKKECKRVLGIKSCHFFGSKKETYKKSSSVNKVTEFVATDDINLFALDDVILEASKIKTKGNATITSKRGNVLFKAVKDSEFYQVLTKSNGFFITYQDKGYIKDKWRMPSIHVGGNLIVDSVNGISADVKVKDGQTLENALTVLSNTPEYKWLSAINSKDNVNWNKVKDAYVSWNHTQTSLNPVVGALISIAAAAATYGSSLSANIGALASNATISAGAGTTIGTIVGTSAQTGMAALISHVSVSLVENKGNLSAALAQVGKSDVVKSIVAGMAISGALQGFDIEFFGDIKNPSEIRLPTLSNDNWSKVVQQVAGKTIIESTLGTAIQGGSFTDNLQTAFLGNIADQFNAEGAHFIGDHGEVIGYPGKVLSHSVVSTLSAEIAGTDPRGAFVGALAAELAAITMESSLFEPRYVNETHRQIDKLQEALQGNETKAQVARFIGAISGAIVTQNPEGIYSAANSADIVYRNNMTEHMFDQLAEDNQRDILSAAKGDEAAAARVVARQQAAVAVTAVAVGGTLILVGGELVIAYGPEMVTAVKGAAATCKAFAPECFNKLVIYTADVVAPEAAVGTGAASLGAIKILSSSEQGAKSISDALKNASKSIWSKGHLENEVITPLVQQIKNEELQSRAMNSLLIEIGKFPSSTQAEKTATMIAAYDIKTGKISVGGSIGKKGITEDMLNKITVDHLKNKLGVDIGGKTSYCNNIVGGCAEVLAADKLIAGGSKIEDIRFTIAVRPKEIVKNNGVLTYDAIIDTCKNCQRTW